MNWQTEHIDLENLKNLSRGDNRVVIKYLTQFYEVVPPRIESLNQASQLEDREEVRRILHKMGPQLQFFGVSDVAASIRRIEMEYQSMPLNELQNLVKDIIVKLGLAVKEVNKVLDEL